MATLNTRPEVPGAGKFIAERLRLTITGTEGHDLKGPCIACESSDAFRIHADSGVGQCFSCGRAWNAFDLCKTVLRDHAAAIQLMIDAGLFDPSYASNGNGKAAGRTEEESIAYWAERKGCTVAGFKAYGARGQKNGSVVFPAYGPDGSRCTTFTLSDWDAIGRKGRYEKDKPAGLFVPEGKRPPKGGTVALTEGLKDSSVLYDLGFFTVGLNTNALNRKFAPLFEGVGEAIVVPDADKPGLRGALKTAAALAGTVPKIRIAQLPTEIADTHGEDVRDILRRFGDNGPAAIKRAIEEAVEPEEFAKRHGLTTGDQEEKEAPAAVKFASLTCAELVAARFEIRFLVDGVLVAGQPCILAGPKKSLKTSLGLGLGLSIATGTPFLGKFNVPEPAAVGIMTGESGLATIQETIIRICRSAEIDPATIDRLRICETVPRFGQEEHEAAFAEFINEWKLSAIVVDPAYMSLPGADAGNIFLQGELLRGVAEICQSAGCTLILAHHTKKNLAKPFDVPELEDIAWAGFQEFARQWLLVNRRERYIPGTGSHKLWLSLGGSVGHGSLWGLDIEEGCNPSRFWHAAVLAMDEIHEEKQSDREHSRKQQNDEKVETDRKAVVAELMKRPDGETKSYIKNVLRMSGERFNFILDTLLEDGIVQPTEIVKAGRIKPMKAFKLSPDSMSE